MHTHCRKIRISRISPHSRRIDDASVWQDKNVSGSFRTELTCTNQLLHYMHALNKKRENNTPPLPLKLNLHVAKKSVASCWVSQHGSMIYQRNTWREQLFRSKLWALNYKRTSLAFISAQNRRFVFQSKNSAIQYIQYLRSFFYCCIIQTCDRFTLNSVADIGQN